MKERKIAYQILKDTVLHHQYASLAMRSMLQGLDDKEKGLVTEIVYGTLRHDRLLRYQWEAYVEKIDPETGILLDMSVYQLQYLDKIPVYAVVHEAVECAKPSQKKLVNAVLHKVIDQPRKISDDPSLTYDIPLWIWKLWVAQYGEPTALRIAQNSQEAKTITYRINSLKTTHEEVAALEGLDWLSDEAFTSQKNLVHSSWLKEGKIAIQDWSSQQPVAFLNLEPGLQVLDVCAAPGTKSCQMAARMKNQGMILALDLYPRRVELINACAKTYGVSILKTQVEDATKVELPPESFDRILCDVPCSGLGVLSGKPEIKLHLKPENLDELVQTQRAILNALAGSLKREGILVYSTCTLNKKENEKQIEHFLKEHANYTLLHQQTNFPDAHQDGFFLAQLRKN